MLDPGGDDGKSWLRRLPATLCITVMPAAAGIQKALIFLGSRPREGGGGNDD